MSVRTQWDRKQKTLEQEINQSASSLRKKNNNNIDKALPRLIKNWGA